MQNTSISHIRHACLTDTHLIWISDNERKLCKYVLPYQPRHISELWEMGRQVGISHFWIMPGTAIDQLKWDFLRLTDGYKVFIPGEIDKDETPKSAACKKGYVPGTPEIYVNYPVPDDGNGFNWVVKTPLDVLAAVDYLSRVTGLDDIKYSPQHIGKEYLKSLFSSTARMRSYIAKPTQDLSDIPFSSAKEIFFARPLTPDMEGMTFFHVDKNAAHPSAASSMFTGTGNPIHLTGNIEANRPGLYRVSYEICGSPFDGKQLPKIIETEWITLDLLKFARKYGYMVDIHEAYVFEHGYNLFGDWARNLWKARQVLKDETVYIHPQGRMNAYLTIKEVMNFTVSALKKDNPNWWCDMVSLARVSRLANLHKCMVENNQIPLYVYVDDMGFVSHEKIPEKAIPAIFQRKTKDGKIIDNRQELGGYKCEWFFEITGKMIEDCAPFAKLQPLQAAGKIHGYMKKIAKERGLIDG